MRVAVVGAGIVGVTTAYELAALGLEVTVFERRGSVAAEASFANAGVLSRPATSRPGRHPACRWQVLRHLLQPPCRRATRRLGAAVASALAVALVARLPAAGACGANRAALQRLAHFSRERLLELTRTLRLDYEQMPGYLVLLRTRARPGAGAARAGAAARTRRDPRRGRRGALPRHRARPQPRDRLARRHPPAAGRRRQLPPLRASAEGRGTAPGCTLPLRHRRARPGARRAGRAGHRRRAAPRIRRRRACAPACRPTRCWPRSA